MDDNGESVADAAAREAYEECGLRVGEHLELVAAMEDADAHRYEAGGWLTEAGFAGQQLHWALFRVVDSAGNDDPARICKLTGLNGEAQEFTAVRYMAIDEAVKQVWPAKRRAYEALQEWLSRNNLS